MSSQTSRNRNGTYEKALAYVDEVRYTFLNQPEVYREFLDNLKEFRSAKLDVPGVTNKISKLFKHHPKLIVGFSAFLPPPYEIEVESDSFDGGYVLVCEPSPSDLTSPLSPTSTVHSSAVSNTTSSTAINGSCTPPIGTVLTTVTSVLNTLPSMVINRFRNQ